MSMICDFVMVSVLFKCHLNLCSVFFFNDPATTEIYTLSLHDALPISNALAFVPDKGTLSVRFLKMLLSLEKKLGSRSEEHTSELQSQFHLVCRLLLEKKKQYPRAHSRWHVN